MAGTSLLMRLKFSLEHSQYKCAFSIPSMPCFFHSVAKDAKAFGTMVKMYIFTLVRFIEHRIL